MRQSFLNGQVTLYAGDCLDVLDTLAENSIDAVVTDPPYELGFMGKSWDASGVAFCPETWAKVLRVLKPGGHMIAFGAPKNYHRLACAIEDAGFELRDSLMWVTGVGFPKSHNIGCICDEHPIPYTHEGAEQTPKCDLRRMRDDDVSQAKFAEKERKEVLFDGLPQHGVSYSQRNKQFQANVWGEEPCMEGRSDLSPSSRELCASEICSVPDRIFSDGEDRRICDGASVNHGDKSWEDTDKDGMCSSSGSQSSEQRHIQSGTVAGQSEPQVDGARKVCNKCGKLLGYKGWGTALKPAYEPIVLARKPLSEKTVAANVLRWGTGALNIDACRVGTTRAVPASLSKCKTPNGVYGDYGGGNEKELDPNMGRWPANLCHDGSQGVLDLFPQSKSTGGKNTTGHSGEMRMGRTSGQGANAGGIGDEGSAARFFYSAKANKKDRAGSKHPTVKPVSLMRWLVRMVTTPNGTVIDPFAGSGTTGQAAIEEGFSVTLIEREEEYRADIKRRFECSDIPLCPSQPDS